MLWGKTFYRGQLWAPIGIQPLESATAFPPDQHINPPSKRKISSKLGVRLQRTTTFGDGECAFLWTLCLRWTMIARLGSK